MRVSLDLLLFPLESLFKSTIEGLVARFQKPSNIKARINTIEAYCVYYPIYKSVQCLKDYDGKLVEGILTGLGEDPTLFVRLLPLIGRIGPSKRLRDEDDKERFRRGSALLYLPEPLLKELEEVKDDVSKVRDLITRNDFDSALKIAEEGFKEKYEKGDIQVPEAEEVVCETLALSASIVKLGAKLDYAKAMTTIDYYYRVLVFENSLGELPKIFMTVLSLLHPPEALPTIWESLEREVRQRLPTAQKLMLIPYIAQRVQTGAMVLEFKYEEFEKTFEEIRRLLK
jgi:hypothetical protein